jgi:hypothetical protein
MERSARLRLGLTALALGALYFYLLLYLIGWTSWHHWPSWWYGAFPSRHSAGVAWIIILHTAGVLSAAVPVAIAAVVIMRREAVLLAAIVGVLGSALGLLSSIDSNVWPLFWTSHPIFVVTDPIKIIAAVPLTAWLIRRISSRSKLSTTAMRQRA